MYRIITDDRRKLGAFELTVNKRKDAKLEKTNTRVYFIKLKISIKTYFRVSDDLNPRYFLK